MRFSYCRIISPPFLCNNISHVAYRSRSFHHAHPQTYEPMVFQNSLERTLEVHRTVNRASLIRKVVNQSKTQEISRPTTTPETSHEARPSNDILSSEPDLNKQYPQPSKPKRVRRKIESSPFRHPSSQLKRDPCQSLQWNTNLKGGRPEQHPWLDYMDHSQEFSDGISQLDAEVRALERYLSPTSNEKKNIDEIVSDIDKLLLGIAPDPPQVIGSRRTGFAMSHSSLDFILPVQDSVFCTTGFRKPSATRPKMLSLHNELLHKVEYALRQNPTYNSTRIQVAGKQHRVLVATHRPTGLQLQFYCGEDLPTSIEYILDFHAEYPLIRPLYMATRLILESQGLFGSGNLSLTPNALLMLLASFLKMNHGRFRQGDGCGKLLLAFLHTYGMDVDLTTTGVAVDPPSHFNADTIKKASMMYDKDRPNDFPAYFRGQRALINMKRRASLRSNSPLATQLCLQDPANYMNDLGRSCYRTAELQSALARAYTLIKESVDLWEPSQLQERGSSVLSSALRVNFRDFGDRRALICSTV